MDNFLLKEKYMHCLLPFRTLALVADLYIYILLIPHIRDKSLSTLKLETSVLKHCCQKSLTWLPDSNQILKSEGTR